MNYNEKKEELKKKHEEALKAIAVANNVDTDVALDMLEANINRGGTYPYVKEEEFKKGWQELIEFVSKEN